MVIIGTKLVLYFFGGGESDGMMESFVNARKRKAAE